MAYDTVANIVSDAAVELGLGTVSDVFASTDPNIVQLRTLLKYQGRDLASDRQWSHLVNEATITTRTLWAASTAYSTATPDVVANNRYYYTCTVSGTSASSGGPTHTSGTAADGTVTWQYSGLAADYALPADFGDMIDQTFWNRTNTLPVGGPLSSQTWQYLAARSTAVALTVLFRPIQGLLRLYPDEDVTGGQNLRYEYRSAYWVAVTGSTTPSKSAPTLNTDVICFDPTMTMRRLKLAFLRAKGFPSQAAQEDYDASFQAAADADSPAPILRLSGGGSWSPLMGPQSVPVTNYGG